MNRPFAIVVAVAGGAAIASASAHDTYLIARDWTPSVGSSVVFDMASSDGFPGLDYGPAAGRIVRLETHVGTAVLGAEPAARDEERSLEIATDAMEGAGSAQIALSLGPRPITLEKESLEHYLEEIAAGEAILAAVAALGDAPFKEVYTKHAQAFFCVEACGEPQEPVGLALEFVLLEGTPRAPERVALMYDGAPLAGRIVNLVAADGARVPLTTDEGGAIAMPADLPPGPMMLSTVRLVPPAAEGEPFTSDFATATFRLGDG